jgi:hypothetical protein
MQYSVEDVRREYRTAKGCAPRCTVACVHQISYIDFWRGKQNLTPATVGEAGAQDLVQIQ